MYIIMGMACDTACVCISIKCRTTTPPPLLNISGSAPEYTLYMYKSKSLI